MGSFLAPILVIIFINTVIFIWVVVVVSRHTRDKAARMNTTINKQQILRMMISISGVLFLFGLTWLFFVLTISVPGLRETFQILFTVFNSLQGFFVFAFILFTEGFSYWKAAFLSCYKSNPTQISLQVNASWKNKSTDVSTLSKSKSETSHNTSTTDHIYSEVDTKQPIHDQKMKELEALRDQTLTDIASPTELVSGDLDTTQKLVLQTDAMVFQIQEEELTKQTNTTSTKPLKVLLKRYSTKKYNRHHVEEVKVHFHQEDSSSSDEDINGAAYSMQLWS